MTDADVLRAFVVEALTDAGAAVEDRLGLLWVRSPPHVRQALEIPETLALAFDAERVGEFGAELIAPGSFLLEGILALAMGRGLWDGGIVPDPPGGWADEAFSLAGFPAGAEARDGAASDATVFLFTFRVTLASDEKREGFHAIAVPAGSEAGWEMPAERADAPLSRTSSSTIPSGLEAAYETATRALREATRDPVEGFRNASLASLEEEVRRILTYFDGSVREVRAAAPSDAPDLVPAIEAERDRRLQEAVERFEPHATAALCGVRVVRAPVASRRVRLAGEPAREIELVVDAFTRTVRGPPCDRCGRTAGPRVRLPGSAVACVACAATAAGSAPLPDRPRSDIPRPRRRAAPGGARSPRGSTERSRSASGTRRGRTTPRGRGTSSRSPP